MRIVYIVRPTDIIGGDHLAEYWHSDEMRRLGYFTSKIEATSPALENEVKASDVAIMWSGCSPDWGIPAAQTVKNSGKKLIVIPNWWNRSRRMKFFGITGDIAPGYTEGVKTVLSMADALAVCTMSEAQECWKLVPRAKIFVMGSGPGEIAVGQREARNYVCCVGRIEQHKNQVTLAAACRNLGMPLVLVGPKTNHDYFLWILEQGGSINWMDELPRKETQEIISEARVHALLSFSETPGLANSEALALGVPAVMGNIGAECEFYREHGIYCAPDSVSDAMQAIQEAWNMRRRKPVVVQTWAEAAKRTDEWIKKNG